MPLKAAFELVLKGENPNLKDKYARCCFIGYGSFTANDFTMMELLSENIDIFMIE